MKIGIITCDGWLRLWDNYGTLFQNYALQTFLQKNGHESFLIQTGGSAGEPFVVRGKRLFFRCLKEPASVVCFFKGAVYARTIGRAERKRLAEFNARHPRFFSPFFEKYIPKTELRFSEAALLAQPPHADAYIVGSDQVWGGVSKTTFLNFGNLDSLRIAYAASTAWKSRSANWIEKARVMLQHIDSVSVREPEGVEICKKAGRMDAVHVCDPTLLLEKEDYMKIVLAENADVAFPRKTVLAYFLNVKSLEQLPWNELVEFVQKRNADLKVVPLQGAEFAVPEEFVFTPSPAEWLNAYDKADCILTNSFHGTVFAVIMKKPFLVVLQNGKTEVENCRFLSVLRKLGLEDRVYNPHKIAESAGGGICCRKWTRQSIGGRFLRDYAPSENRRRTSCSAHFRSGKFRSVSSESKHDKIIQSSSSPLRHGGLFCARKERRILCGSIEK